MEFVGPKFENVKLLNIFETNVKVFSYHNINLAHNLVWSKLFCFILFYAYIYIFKCIYLLIEDSLQSMLYFVVSPLAS